MVTLISNSLKGGKNMEILNNIPKLKFNPKEVKKFIDSIAIYSDGDDSSITGGATCVEWDEFLKNLFGKKVVYDRHLFELIQKVDYELWQKWDRITADYEDMMLGLISKEELEKRFREIENEIMRKYGNRLLEIEVTGIDSVFVFKP